MLGFCFTFSIRYEPFYHGLAAQMSGIQNVKRNATLIEMQNLLLGFISTATSFMANIDFIHSLHNLNINANILIMFENKQPLFDK